MNRSKLGVAKVRERAAFQRKRIEFEKEKNWKWKERERVLVEKKEREISHRKLKDEKAKLASGDM